MSLQWGDSADSKWDQPRNHTRTKDQGQVWAGRILPCEYWCELTHTVQAQRLANKFTLTGRHTNIQNSNAQIKFTSTAWHTVCTVYIIQIYTFIHEKQADNCFCSTAEGGRQSVSVCCSRLLSPQLQLQPSNATSGHVAFQMSPRRMSVCAAKRKRQHKRETACACVCEWETDRECSGE